VGGLFLIIYSIITVTVKNKKSIKQIARFNNRRLTSWFLNKSLGGRSIPCIFIMTVTVKNKKSIKQIQQP